MDSWKKTIVSVFSQSLTNSFTANKSADSTSLQLNTPLSNSNIYIVLKSSWLLTQSNFYSDQLDSSWSSLTDHSVPFSLKWSLTAVTSSENKKSISGHFNWMFQHDCFSFLHQNSSLHTVRNLFLVLMRAHRDTHILSLWTRKWIDFCPFLVAVFSSGGVNSLSALVRHSSIQHSSLSAPGCSPCVSMDRADSSSAAAASYMRKTCRRQLQLKGGTVHKTNMQRLTELLGLFLAWQVLTYKIIQGMEVRRHNLDV